MHTKAFKIVARYRKNGYLLLMKELFLSKITKPPEIIVNDFFLSLCLFLSSCFHAVKGKRLELT